MQVPFDQASSSSSNDQVPSSPTKGEAEEPFQDGINWPECLLTSSPISLLAYYPLAAALSYKTQNLSKFVTLSTSTTPINHPFFLTALMECHRSVSSLMSDFEEEWENFGFQPSSTGDHVLANGDKTVSRQLMGFVVHPPLLCSCSFAGSPSLPSGKKRPASGRNLPLF